MRVISCPAVSSMTTNCGSFKPELRATRVAAGIPMTTARAANPMLTGTTHGPGSHRDTMAQTITVAREPQVPGPGFIRPAPKNVATSVAQRGARGRVVTSSGRELGAGTLGSLVLFIIRMAGVGRWFEFLIGIGQRGRYDVVSPGPLTQINRAATLAAKREFGVRTLHRILADGATQLENTLRHSQRNGVFSREFSQPGRSRALR